MSLRKNVGLPHKFPLYCYLTFHSDQHIAECLSDCQRLVCSGKFMKVVELWQVAVIRIVAGSNFSTG